MRACTGGGVNVTEAVRRVRVRGGVENGEVLREDAPDTGVLSEPSRINELSTAATPIQRRPKAAKCCAVPSRAAPNVDKQHKPVDL